MKINQYLAAAACVVLFCSSASAQLSGDSFASARQTKQANFVYVYNNSTDFARQNASGEVKGVLIDLMSEFSTFLAEKYDINVNVSYQRIDQSNFAEFLSSVQNGKGGVFGLSNASISEERREILQFSPPFIKNIIVLVTHNSVPNLSSMSAIGQEFGDMTAFSVTSSVYLARLERIKQQLYPDMQIKLYNSGLEVMREIAKDQKAFAIVDLLYYLGFLKEGYAVKRHSVGDEAGDEFGIIMPKNSDWKPVLDEFFATGFLESPKYREIVSNHLGKAALRLIR